MGRVYQKKKKQKVLTYPIMNIVGICVAKRKSRIRKDRVLTKEEISYLNNVLDRLCEYFSISIDEIKVGCRDSKRTMARQMFFFLVRKERKIPYIQLAEFMDYKGHTMAIHGERRIFNYLKLDDPYFRDIWNGWNKFKK